MRSNHPSIVAVSDDYYTPNHIKRKLLMILAGCLLLVFGFSLLWKPLRLVVFGASAKAEATRVVKAKAGLPDLVLCDDVQIQMNLEPRDRSYIFWNEFRFHTPDGKAVNLRANVGSIGKPLYPLADADGLPTTDLVAYDPAQPKIAVFPMIVSTWLIPAMLIVIGVACLTIGSFLYYWAAVPIQLPHIASPGKSGK